MIELATGSIVDADADALVNTVNTVGVMGKGVALQFRQAFPDNYAAYKKACDANEVVTGRMFVYRRNTLTPPFHIINFPTKQHWRQPSRLEYIDEGLADLVRVIRDEAIESIAVPPLGCGSGGLNWDDVRPRIQSALNQVPDTRVVLFEPDGPPGPQAMPVRTKRPAMTPSRAALLALFAAYDQVTYSLTKVEVQKLAYLLQAAGEPLKLDFDKAQYGPYAQKLEHVLQRMEGHFTRGYGDRTGEPTNLLLDTEAVREAATALQATPEVSKRIEHVTALLDGFETPYGLELLATLHWIASFEMPNAKDHLDTAIDGVRAWSQRKSDRFRPDHIESAWRRLREHGWLDKDTSSSS